MPIVVPTPKFIEAFRTSLPTVFDTTVVPLPSLERLASSAPNPLTLADLAEAVGASFDLLDRVNSRRQPLPSQLVEPIASALGVQRGEVEAAAGSVLVLGADLGRRALSPLPPDRLLGDVIYARPMRPTAPVVFPGA